MARVKRRRIDPTIPNASSEDEPAPNETATRRTKDVASLPENFIPYSLISRNANTSAKSAATTNGKKRKRADREWADPSLMKSPYDSKLDTEFKIRPLSDREGVYWAWSQMESCQSFPLTKSLTVDVGDVVYVEGSGDTRVRQLDEKSQAYDDCWVGYVCEIRSLVAEKSGHSTSANPDAITFMLVNWLYRPENLPRKPKQDFADGEVFPSNHLDIIESTTICGKVRNIQRIDENDLTSVAGGYEELCWRYVFDAFTQNLAKGIPRCICHNPINPDFGPLICNGNNGCNLWMHEQCVKDDVLERLYRRYVLGEDPKDILGGPSDAKDLKPGKGTAKRAQIVQQRVKESKTYFDVQLVPPAQDTLAKAPFLGRVKLLKDDINNEDISKGTKLKSRFEYPIRCVQCRKVLRQQMAHRLLRPKGSGTSKERPSSDTPEKTDQTSEAHTSA